MVQVIKFLQFSKLFLIWYTHGEGGEKEKEREWERLPPSPIPQSSAIGPTRF